MYFDHNITNTFNKLIHKIETSTTSETEKQEAKSLLNQFLSHPLAVSIIGSTLGAAIDLI